MGMKSSGVVAPRRATLAVVLATGVATTLSGCYVVPVNQHPAHYPTTTHVVLPAPAPQPVTFAARLYPANDLATSYGMVNAIVTNDLNGRGNFNTTISGESFVGEATRKAGSSRDGLANGAGNRGSYINCHYTMNSATLGTGSCTLSNGARFTMHVGQ
jgi:hypothetical protein